MYKVNPLYDPNQGQCPYCGCIEWDLEREDYGIAGDGVQTNHERHRCVKCEGKIEIIYKQTDWKAISAEPEPESESESQPPALHAEAMGLFTICIKQTKPDSRKLIISSNDMQSVEALFKDRSLTDFEAFENILTNSFGFHRVLPEEVGALTNSILIGRDGWVYWYPDYQVWDMRDRMLEYGEIIMEGHKL